jgi:hypothetical protein
MRSRSVEPEACRRGAGLCALLALLVLGAGCQRTLLSQAPAEGGCDPALQGHWASAGTRSTAAGEVEATIGADCTLLLVEHGAEGARHWPSIVLSSARVGRRDLLWLDATAANRAFDIAPTALDREGSVYLFAYSASARRLTVVPLDHRRLAHRVIDSALAGAALADGHDLVLRLDGGRDELTALLGARNSFARKEAMRFDRRSAVPSP